MRTTQAGHLVGLGDSGWHLWREVVLRSTGFPARGVTSLNDPELAAAADAAENVAGAGDLSAYQRAYAAATSDLAARMRKIAGDQRFREAVAWQTRQVVANCLDRVVAGEPRNVLGRKHESVIASYWQRYCLKNDTIGFFGPVGWATWSDSTRALGVEPGAELLSGRRTYFEVWAIDVVGEALAADSRILPWLSPRRSAECQLDGTVFHRPQQGPILLSEAEAEVLSLCDGWRVNMEIAEELLWSGHPELGSVGDTLELITSMRDRRLIRLDLSSPICARPEEHLRRRLHRIGDEALRTELLGRLDELLDARDAVASAAGGGPRLITAIDDANDTFSRLTGAAPVRRPGVTYGGRTILYEDTVRDVKVELGQPLLNALAAPLGLLLDSARWFVAEAARRYRAVFDEAYERVRGRLGQDAVPLPAVVASATPSLQRSAREIPQPVREVAEELQHRWEAILGLPAEGSRHHVRSGDIAESVRAAFPSTGPAWSEALHHSPDIMIAADSPEAVERGDFYLVLGELHLAANTVESRLFVEQHPQPDRLYAADAADHGDRRIYLAPGKHWPQVNSRSYPPSALLSADYTYWSLYPDSDPMPAPALPAAALLVERDGTGLIVRSRDSTHRYPLLEVVGELLSAAVVNGFRPLLPARHRPRVSIDRLVIARESWTLPVREADWAKIKNESHRLLAARSWRASLGLPEQVFYKLPHESKPSYLDFTSLALVNLFGKGLRRAAEESEGTFTMTELLPGSDQLWLTDAAGEAYASELRFVAVDRAAASVAQPARP